MRIALANSTVDQPKGTLYGGQQAVALQTNDQLMTAQGFDDEILAYRNGAPDPRPRHRAGDRRAARTRRLQAG